MWVESVRLRNIKCFADMTLSFTERQASHPSAQPYRWITLLGENAAGKSTVLQALGLLLAGPEAARVLLPRAAGWSGDEEGPGELSVVLRGDPDRDPGLKKTANPFTYSYLLTPEAPVQIENETYSEPAVVENRSPDLTWMRANAFSSRSEGWFAAGYGPFRRLTRKRQVLLPDLDAPTRASNFLTQFLEEDALTTFERWMVTLDYRIARNPSDGEATKMRDRGIAAISRLLPRKAEIHIARDGQVQFRMDGVDVPTIAMSDGYRSMVALAGDLVWRLMQAFPGEEDPTRASGVVLIDELDIHLHPSWQREIAGWLRAAFPNLQFIVATHSPWIAMGAGEDALTLHFELRGRHTTVAAVEDLFALDVGRALASEGFGLPSAFSPEAQREIEEYHDLNRRRDSLTAEERKELERLQSFMRRAQPIGDPFDDGLGARIRDYLDRTLP